MINIERVCYYYHLWLSIISMVIGYAIIAVGMWDSKNTIALNIFFILVFWIAGTICFLMLPACIMAASTLGRIFCFLPFIAGDYSLFSTALFCWAIINIVTLYLSINGYDSDEELGVFLFN